MNKQEFRRRRKQEAELLRDKAFFTYLFAGIIVWAALFMMIAYSGVFNPAFEAVQRFDRSVSHKITPIQVENVTEETVEENVVDEWSYQEEYWEENTWEENR